MAKDKYTLRYLPTFYNDLDRLPDAESFEPYHSRKEREYPYYRIYVKNYVIYYVVIPDGKNKKIMEIRRILHGLQDRDKSI